MKKISTVEKGNFEKLKSYVVYILNYFSYRFECFCSVDEH